MGDVAGQKPEEQPARREPKASNEESLSQESQSRNGGEAEPPPQSSVEELAGLDPAARDAVLRAENDALIAYNKAMKAYKEAVDLKAKAGVARAPDEGPRARPSQSRLVRRERVRRKRKK
jgi:hypothetical protein